MDKIRKNFESVEERNKVSNELLRSGYTIYKVGGTAESGLFIIYGKSEEE